jgi:cation:H+ antiporter
MGMQHYLALIGGVMCAAVGGDLFVRAVVGLGRAMRISAAIMGATFAAFATSSPELSVAINSAIEGQPQIALGDALGSNVVNIALILGIALLIAPIRSTRDSLRRDFPVALAVPLITAVLVLDGTLSRVDGIILLFVFGTWITAMVLQAQRDRGISGTADTPGALRPLIQGIAGLVVLTVAGRLIVNGAISLASLIGISEFAVGETVVAVGTSVPELATAVIARARGHEEISLGMLLGSNIFNGLWIVGVAAVVFPIAMDWQQVALALGYGVLVMVAAYPPRHGLVGRGRGLVLVALYGTYVVAVLIS